jgi:hypothetical protein
MHCSLLLLTEDSLSHTNTELAVSLSVAEGLTKSMGRVLGRAVKKFLVF